MLPPPLVPSLRDSKFGSPEGPEDPSQWTLSPCHPEPLCSLSLAGLHQGIWPQRLA
jgi:hypothetical protein